MCAHRYAVLLAAAALVPHAASAAQLRLGAGARSAGHSDDVVLDSVGVIPVSTTMQCIIALSCQYFFIYTILVVVGALRSMVDDPGAFDSQPVVQLLETTQNTVNYVPMLCVLFLACRMRAIQLTYGHTEKYGLPQWWVQIAMQVCTWAVFGQLLVILMFPCLFGHVPSTDNDGNCYAPKIKNTGGVICLLIVRYFLMLLLYGGFTVVCVGIWVMQGPSEVQPSVSPSVICVMLLTVQFFTIYLLLAIVKSFNQLNGYAHTTMVDILQLAAYTIVFAPMLCILFIIARVRALQMDRVHGHPQWWAQYCFYICTCSTIAQTLLVVIVPLTMGGQVTKGRSEGDITFRMSSSAVSHVLTAFRVVALLCLYGGYGGVLVSVIAMEHPKGPEYTPPVSPAMQCVMLLSLQFFLIYLLLIVVNLVKPLTTTSQLEGLQGTLESGRLTVSICPMLCILFVALRMRALQMTENTGAPQGWAQDCMYVATTTVFLQLILALLAGCISGRSSAFGRHSDGVGVPKDSKCLRYFLPGCRFLLLLVTYGAAVVVIVAFFVMTPATANGRGATIPVVSDSHLR